MICFYFLKKGTKSTIRTWKRKKKHGRGNFLEVTLYFLCLSPPIRSCPGLKWEWPKKKRRRKPESMVFRLPCVHW